MSLEPAARTTDQIAHGFGALAMLAGAVIGAAVGVALVAATVASGGAALAVVGAAVAAVGATAGGGLALGQVVKGLTTIFDLPEPTSGVLSIGSTNVFVNSLSALRAGMDTAVVCSGIPINHILSPMPLVPIAEGSATVFVNGMPMARLTSKMVCGAHVKSASHDTFVGGPTARVLAVNDFEENLHTALEYLGYAALAGGVIVAAITGVAALATFVAVGAAIYGGMIVLGDLGNALGPGYADLFQGVAGIVLIGVGTKKAFDALPEEPVPNSEPNEFPGSTPESDEAANNVVKTMDDEGIGAKRAKVVTALSHEDGSVSIGTSGSSADAANVQSRLDGKLPDNYTLGNDMSNPGSLEPAQYPDGSEHASPTCAETRAWQAAQQNPSPVTGQTTVWRGNGANPYPAEPGSSAMNPCPSCEKNAGTIMSGGDD